MAGFSHLCHAWPGAVPPTAAALRPCFQPVVELAWAVLEAAAAAGRSASTNTSNSSSSSSGSGGDSGWSQAVAKAMVVPVMLADMFRLARSADAKLGAWQPHAQLFASDALLKLVLMHAGMAVGFLYKQQQGKQPGVQPYHQQLLAELGVQAVEHLTDKHQEVWLASLPGAFAMAVSVLDLRVTAAATAAASSNSSGHSPSATSPPATPTSVSSSSPPAATAAATAAAATATMSGGVELRLCELLLLTVLEYAVLTAAASEDNVTSLAAAVSRCVDVSQHVQRMQLDMRTAAAGTSAGEKLAAADFTNLLLQPLLLQLAPAAMQAVRAAAAAAAGASPAAVSLKMSCADATASVGADEGIRLLMNTLTYDAMRSGGLEVLALPQCRE
jgi:hypothetical protein